MGQGKRPSSSTDSATRPRSGPSDEEASLVLGLKAGDRGTFREAVIRYSPRMLATARAIVGASQAEDIVQEAWITVYRQIDTFEQRSALGTWLNRIVHNRAISHLRAHAREVTVSDRDGEAPDQAWFDARGRWVDAPGPWTASAPDELLTADALQDCIDKHLQQMPDSQRAVVVLRDMQGESFETICNDLDISASNARVLLHRGRLKLMKMVDHFQESGTC